MTRIPIALATDSQTATETVEQLGQLTPSDWLWAGALTAGSIILAVVANRVTRRLARAQLAPFVARLVGRLAGIVVFVVGFFYAMQQVGVSLTPFLGLVGLLGLALALAFQEVLENFIAGIFLSARRPFRQGDEITSAGYEGFVEDISLRELTMKTFDGERVYIPNSAVWQNPIVNHTSEEIRRTRLEVGVAYNSSLRQVGELLVDTLKGIEGVRDEPPPQAYAHEFGDSSINFALRFWHDASTRDEWAVRDEVLKSVHEALAEAGVEIPFPQRVVEIIGGDDA